MNDEGSITVKAGTKFRRGDEMYKLTRPLNLTYTEREGSKAGIYLSGSPLDPERVTRFDLTPEDEDNGLRRAAGRFALSLAQRYHDLTGQDSRRRTQREFEDIEKLREIFEFVDLTF